MKRCAFVLSLLLAGCATVTNTDTSPVLETPADSLQKVADDVWQHELSRSLALQIKYGVPIERLPDITYADAEADAQFAQSIEARLDKLDTTKLGEDDRITLAMLRWNDKQTIGYLPNFWYRSPITPYHSQLLYVMNALKSRPFRHAADVAAYLRLLSEVPRFFDQAAEVTRAQASRGIRLPKAEVATVKEMLAEYAKAADDSPFAVATARLQALPLDQREALDTQSRQIIEKGIDPALKRLLDVFNDAYVAAAPEAVGLSQYPGGAEAYRYFIGLETSTSMTPEEIHQLGLSSIARIDAQLAEVQKAAGFTGTLAEFRQFLKTDPRFFAKTPDEVKARLTGYVHRIEPQIPRFFAQTPRAPYDVERLDPHLESGVTYGYYQVPTASDPVGHYYFNGSHLDQRNLLFGAALIAHELIPGHHFQIARQEENESLPMFRRESFPTAFVEGWGEYAAVLGNEMGLYADPYDKAGRLMMDSMLSARLVVDTGMNALGWSRQRAMDYLREHTMMSDTEIATETLRYAADIPAQALAYKIGSLKILELRERARRELGPRFDIRQFHEWLLAPGAMPLPVLEEHVRRAIAAVAGS